MDVVTRRRLLTILVASACASPVCAWPRLDGVRRIGFLALRSRSTPASPDPWYNAFADEMRKLGYAEGGNIVTEWRFADGKYDRLPQLASELVRAGAEVIVAQSTPATEAAQQATKTVPIVAIGIGAPVASGLGVRLARPGGNVTGVSMMLDAVIPKQFEMLRVLLPGASRIGVLMNPDNPTRRGYQRVFEQGARPFGMQIEPEDARNEDEFRRAFAAMAKRGADAVIISADGSFYRHGALFAELGLAHQLPTMDTYREHAQAGVLVSYGPDVAASYRRGAIYVDKILKGAKPGDLPFEQPSKIHLAINRKTATALRISVSRELLLRADEVLD
jgi:putative ABC transport system substrate-binding protein